MKKLWLTYAWIDDAEGDVDYLIQQLDSKIDLHFDKRNLVPGRRLWNQIGGYITDPNQCDGWAFLVTKNSLQSNACLEELAYAIQRAIDTRADEFPIIGLLHNVDVSELPPALKVRLCIQMSSPDWVNHVISSLENRSPGYSPSRVSRFISLEHVYSDRKYLEVRSRFEPVAPCLIAVPLSEKTSCEVGMLVVGPPNSPPSGSYGTMINGYLEDEAVILDNKVFVWGANNGVTTSQSYYLSYNKTPSIIWVGQRSLMVQIETASMQVIDHQ